MNLQSLDKIIDSNKAMAKHLLEELGGFLPFAHGSSFSGTIIQVATYFGEEYPEVSTLFKELKRALLRSDLDHNFEFASICREVYYTPADTNIKCDAIEIKISSRRIGDIDVFITYEIEAGKVVFGKQFREQGDLKLFDDSSKS